MKMSSQRRALARIYKRRGRYEIPALTSAETPRVEEGAKPDSSWRFSAELGNLLSPPCNSECCPAASVRCSLLINWNRPLVEGCALVRMTRPMEPATMVRRLC